MRKILIVLLTLISLASYSQQQVDSSGQLTPLGSYPVTSSKYVKGANRSVQTIQQRNDIPMYLRDTGMLVFVQADTTTYQLRNGIADSNWVVFKTGGAGNARTIIDTVQTTGQFLTIAAYSGGGRVVSLSTIGENGSGFIPTYVTAGDSTYIDYAFAPNGQVIYKLTVINATDTLRGGGTEIGNGGGGGGSGDLTYQSIVNALGFTPTASPVDYNALVNRPALKTVATSGLYADLTGRPSFSTVATSGSYTDLLNKPSFSTVATSGSYTDLLNKPSFATVATSGLYADLSGKPSLSTVATSGLYADLSGKPTIPAQLNLTASNGVIVSGSYPNITARIDTNYLNNYLSTHAIASTGGTLNTCYLNFVRFGILSAKDAGETLQQYELTQRTADSLGIPVIRQGITMGTSSGYNAVTDLLNSDRQVQININLTPIDGSRNFTSNAERAAAINYLDTLFSNTLAPSGGDTLIVASNEQGNTGYHTIDTSNNLTVQSAYLYYMNELKPIDSIAKLYGNHFQTADGAVTGPAGWWFVWKNLMDSGRTSEANLVAARVFPSGTNLNNYPTGTYAKTIKFTQQLLPYLRTSGINYVNVHFNMPTNGVDTSHIDHNLIPLYVEAWKNLTGKDVITNELASNSMNPNIIGEEIADCVHSGMQWILLYDGTNRTTNPTFAGTDVSFRNLGNSINNVGVTVRNVIQALKR